MGRLQMVRKPTLKPRFKGEDFQATDAPPARPAQPTAHKMTEAEYVTKLKQPYYRVVSILVEDQGKSVLRIQAEKHQGFAPVKGGLRVYSQSVAGLLLVDIAPHLLKARKALMAIDPQIVRKVRKNLKKSVDTKE